MGTPQPRGGAASEIDSLPNPADRRLLSLLHGTPSPWMHGTRRRPVLPSPIAGNEPLVNPAVEAQAISVSVFFQRRSAT